MVPGVAHVEIDAEDALSGYAIGGVYEFGTAGLNLDAAAAGDASATAKFQVVVGLALAVLAAVGAGAAARARRSGLLRLPGGQHLRLVGDVHHRGRYLAQA